MTPSVTTSSEPAGLRHERRDANAGWLLALGVVLCVTVALAFLTTRLLMGYLVREEPSGPQASSLATTPERPPAPRLQTNPSLDLGQKRASEDLALRSYGWVDRSAGTVRIPIDRAMELIAQRAARKPAQRSGGRSVTREAPPTRSP